MASILVVDDDAQIRSLLRQALERAGFEVREASDGREALRCYARTPVDLVITDIMMPEKDGLEIIKALRRHSTHPKIVAITGGLKDDCFALEAATFLGAEGILTKPVQIRRLLKIVRELLGSRRDDSDPSLSTLR
ncbi:MAG: response regulator [Nitrospiraceae bacterium]